MSNPKKKPKEIMHTFDCRSVLTADQAFNCPLCKLRATAPKLLIAARGVLAKWDRGDLAGAVCVLARVADEAEGKS